MKSEKAKLDFLTNDSIRFWEYSRVFYNLVLFIVVAIFWGREIFAGSLRDWMSASLLLMVLAVIANSLFCLAYVAEFAYRKLPLSYAIQPFRWLVLGIGISIAVALELWIILRPGMA